MLRPSLAGRISLDDILSHPWCGWLYPFKICNHSFAPWEPTGVIFARGRTLLSESFGNSITVPEYMNAMIFEYIYHVQYFTSTFQLNPLQVRERPASGAAVHQRRPHQRQWPLAVRPLQVRLLCFLSLSWCAWLQSCQDPRRWQNALIIAVAPPIYLRRLQSRCRCAKGKYAMVGTYHDVPASADANYGACTCRRQSEVQLLELTARAAEDSHSRDCDCSAELQRRVAAENGKRA